MPRLVTLTYGSGAALGAACRRVRCAGLFGSAPRWAPTCSSWCSAGRHRRHWIDLRLILTGFSLGLVKGHQGRLPPRSDTVVFVIMIIVLLVRPAGLFGRALAPLIHPSRGGDRPTRAAKQPAPPRSGTARSCITSSSCSLSRRLWPTGVPDESAVLCAVRPLVQHAARIWGPAVVRPCGLLRACQLCLRLRGQVVGPDANWRSCPAPVGDGAGHSLRPDRHPAAGHLFRHDHAGAGAAALLRLRAGPGFTGGENGIQGVPRGKLFGVIDLAEDRALYVVVAAISWRVCCSSTDRSPFGQVCSDPRQ